MKLIGNKIWSGAKKGFIDTRHEDWLWKYVRSLWFTCWTSTLFHLCNYIRYMISINLDIFITFYFYACRWNIKIWNEMKSLIKTFQITQVQYPLKVMKRWSMEVAQATTIIRATKDEQYFWMLLLLVYFVISIYEKQTFLSMWTYHINWMGISSQ